MNGNGASAVPRRERIAFLLEHLEDVRAGVRDSAGSGEHIPLMCRAWNSPGYQELERLLPLLRSECPALAWHVTQTYFAERRRVRVCPRCDARVDVWSSTAFHTHGRKRVALVARVVRVVPEQVRPELVAVALAWLDEHWRGGVFIPAELAPLVGVA